ncbi:sodium/solute symporter [Alienimonas californiensis]
MPHEASLTAVLIFAAFVAGTLILSWWLGRRTKGAAGYFAAHGQIPWFVNGVAFAGDYLSAASFLGICGMIAFYGYDGFLYSIGFLAGWVVALFVIAEPMKRLGKFTFADALDAKFNSKGIKIAAGLSTLAVSIFYLIPQMVGAGALVTPLLGLPHWVGVTLVGGVVIAIVTTAGMVSTTWVQFIKGGLLVVFSTILVGLVLWRGLGDGQWADEEVDYVGAVDVFRSSGLKSWAGGDETYSLGRPGESDANVLLNAKGTFYEAALLAAKEVAPGETVFVTRHDYSRTSARHAYKGEVRGFWMFPYDRERPSKSGEKIVDYGVRELVVLGIGDELGASSRAITEIGQYRMPIGAPTPAEERGPVKLLQRLGDGFAVLPEKAFQIDVPELGQITLIAKGGSSGEALLTPGNHPKFADIKSDELLGKINFLSLMLALFCGTASLPHILIRYYTVKDAAAARKSTIVGIMVIGFFYVLTLYIGLGAMTSGALDPTDSNMAAPLLARSFGEWLFACISAVAFTTVLGTVSGLILASAGAVSHDLMTHGLGIEMDEAKQVRVAKIASVVVGVIAIGLGIAFQGMNVSYLVGWAFSVAASANLPALVCILFWKGTTKQGVIAGVTVGMISSLAWILLSSDTYGEVYGLDPADALTPFTQPGIVTIPLGFAALVLTSLLTKTRAAA